MSGRKRHPTGTCSSLCAALFGVGGKALQTAVPRSWCLRAGDLDWPCSELSSICGPARHVLLPIAPKIKRWT